MIKKIALPLLLIFSIVACTTPSKEKSEEAEIPRTKDQEVIDEAIAFHGMGGLNDAEFTLTFRSKAYTYRNANGMYEYTRTQTDSAGAVIKDVMNNEGLIRYIDGAVAEINEERRAAYTRSVNSVIYFFRLPFGLNDPAVMKEYVGETEIKGKTYHEVRVTFQQQGGGEDFDDVFLYWFDKEDYSMDYLAYLYHTDGGGMRFREAINARRVNGVLVQDYINMRPEDEKIDIMTIDELYEAGKLRVLSEIINEDITIKAN